MISCKVTEAKPAFPAKSRSRSLRPIRNGQCRHDGNSLEENSIEGMLNGKRIHLEFPLALNAYIQLNGFHTTGNE